MPSDVAVNLAKTVLAAGSAGGTYVGGTGGQVAGFLANQIDIAIDFVKECGGKPNPKLLSLMLLKKGFAIGSMGVDGKNEIGQCMAAIGSMTLSLALTAASLPTGAGAVVTALSTLADAYAVESACAAPVQKAYDAKLNEMANSAFAASIYRDLMRTLSQAGGGFPITP